MIVPESLKFLLLSLSLLITGSWLYGFSSYPHAQTQTKPSKNSQKKSSMSAHQAVIGQPAPPFQLSDGKGNTITASHFKGKWFLLTFWASWCSACQQEFPSLVRLSRKLPQLTLVSASIDDEWGSVGQYITQHPQFRLQSSPMRILWDRGQVNSKRFGTFKIPESYLIDPKGIVRYKFMGALPWDDPKMIEALQAFMKKFTP